MPAATAPSTGLDARAVAVRLAGRPVLEAVDLVLPAGEVVALVAPSGAGKSTLLRALVRLVPRCAGRVSLVGEDADAMAAAALRRQVAFVAQAPAMLPGTVAANLAHGLPRLDAAGRDRALGLAGLDPSFAARAAGELSGGERTRVAIARALARDPRVLLLDEPTAALDADAAAALGGRLRALAADGLAVCAATHDLPWVARWADRRTGLR